MAIQVKKAAVGDAPNTGAPGFTPPPVRPAPPDEITTVRHPTPAGLGMNGFAGASSLVPGTTLRSPLAENMRAVSEGDEGMLDRIAKLGVGKRVIADVDLMSPQTRDVSQEQYPSAHGQSRRQADEGSPGGTVPSHCGAPVTDDWAARRAERLK